MIPVVDVFAGPGGLNEGFSAVEDGDGSPVFDVVASFEKDPDAVRTLTLRAATRLLPDKAGYAPYLSTLRTARGLQDFAANDQIASALQHAAAHIHQIELGEPNRHRVNEIIDGSLNGSRQWVLIGGPPCQAYSLVGRSRRAHDEKFYEDEKHFLYREYLDIIKEHRPTVFVMENVKGLLSASHGGTRMFDLILNDLSVDGAYEIRSLVVGDSSPAPQDFVIRAEEFGIPQRRHRVILVGVHKDLPRGELDVLEPSGPVLVEDVIRGLAKVRPVVSKRTDTLRDWDTAREFGIVLGKDWLERQQSRPDHTRSGKDDEAVERLRRWIGRAGVPIAQHEPRAHMTSDLARYAFMATVARNGYSPKVDGFPDELRPEHKNLDGSVTPFLDRFKVQAWHRPSSTIASHISKDGHYYIHPDAQQARSLTVREAARLQTFPDDYFFCGTRTMQYHQVGNAVPPFLAYQIAQKVQRLLDSA